MKKLLLLLFLLVSLSIYAQPPGMYPPLSVCDDSSNDGFALFDLTTALPIIFNGLDVSIHEVHFYPSDTDALNNTNEITNLNSYVNSVMGLQTLGIRVINTALSEIHYGGMNLVVNPLPIANPGVLYFCDTMELPIYNLQDANAQITGGNTSVTVTYYLTLTDAQTGANSVGPGYDPIVTPVQILYARVQNTSTSCYSITTLTLNTHNCVPCTSSAPLHLSASNITDTSFLLSFETTYGMGNQASLISVVPYGAPPSETGTVSVMTIQNSQMITGLQSESCYSIYMKGFCGYGYSNWSEPLNICMPNCANSGACSQVLLLNAFLDSNNNGIKDTGEVGFNNGNFVYQINNSGTNQYGFANNGSYYILDSNPTNSYTISFVINGNFVAYYTTSATFTNVTLPTGSGVHNLYFPIVETAPFTDVSVQLTPTGQPRPGFTYSNTIRYQNIGTQTIANGTLTFTKDPNISMQSVSQTGTIPITNGFTYNFTNLAPFEIRYITVSMTVPTIPTVNLSDLVSNTVSIQVNNDTNSSNNNSYLYQIITGSYDPNDKMESHGGKIVHSTFTANDYLYYTIQFENTGTASADFVRVEDALDSQLDESTFEMIAASHNVNTKRVGNQLTWHFYNINLPTTSSNPNGSHGYVSFKIKPKAGYAIGDIIPNTAEIFFDFNPAIVTNTFNTEFVPFLGNSVFNPSVIEMYPNPTTNFVTIAINNSVEKISKVSIYDVSGKRIYTSNNTTLGPITIDVSRFDKGIYLVELLSDQNSKVTKKLLLK